MSVLLQRMRLQTLPQDAFELVLVDNGSPDFSPPDNLAPNVSVLRCAIPGSYAARNLGAQHANGDWLAFTDADCAPAIDWLANLERLVVEEEIAETLIAGAVEIVPVSATPGPYEIYDIVKGIPQDRYVARGYAATANLAVPRPVFDQLGGFDAARFSGGDADFCRRAKQKGFPIIYRPGMRVEHPSRTTWEEIATKARRVKGGQITAGTRGRRALWMLRTLAPPLRATANFLTATRFPLKYRLTATAVLFRIWFAELKEAIRLVIGGMPERR